MDNLGGAIVLAIIFGVIGFIAGWQIFAPDVEIEFIFGMTDDILSNLLSNALLSGLRTKIWFIAGIGAFIGFIIGLNIDKKKS